MIDWALIALGIKHEAQSGEQASMRSKKNTL